MPFGSEGPEEGIALALSGGGFRATLFHIGACWRLLELGVLGKLKRISSVSGGSIFAGVLAASWDQLRADLTTANYQALVVDPLRAFCRQSVDSSAIAEGALTPWESAAAHIENRYRSALFDVALSQLPELSNIRLQRDQPTNRSFLSIFEAVYGGLSNRAYT